MDRINRKILQILEADGRISNLELANQVGLSPSACLRRVQELENSGIIQGYRAVINRAAIGRGVTAYLGIGLSEHSKSSQRAFERAVRKAPEIFECHNVTGTIEYLLRAEVEDLAAYKRLHTDVIGTLPTVNSITSYIVLESTKDQRA